MDYLDFMAFDSGPGQIMLRERLFYDFMQSNSTPPARSTDEKIALLFSLLEKADERLMKNRQNVQKLIQEMRVTYAANANNPIDQSGLNLQ